MLSKKMVCFKIKTKHKFNISRLEFPKMRNLTKRAVIDVRKPTTKGTEMTCTFICENLIAIF